MLSSRFSIEDYEQVTEESSDSVITPTDVPEWKRKMMEGRARD